MRRRVWVGLGLLLLGVAGVAAWRLPLRPLLTFLQFRLEPSAARLLHFMKLQGPDGQEIFLLGTTHENHYRDEAYSIWHLKAAILQTRPDVVLIESMPEAVAAGALGEGPVEMPFVATVAREAGILLVGIDAGWDGGWRGRQERMFQNVQGALLGHRRILLTVGFMHVQSFVDQLQGAGFVAVPFSEEEKRAILDAPVDKRAPAGLQEALETAIAAAPARISDPAELQRFVELRRRVKAELPAGALPTARP